MKLIVREPPIRPVAYETAKTDLNASHGGTRILRANVLPCPRAHQTAALFMAGFLCTENTRWSLGSCANLQMASFKIGYV